MQQNWDAHLYDDKHAFVFGYGQDLLALLAPQPGERILDLGCGTGHLTHQIAQSGAHVSGLDFSAAMLATARAQYPHLEFIQADAANFELAEPCDAIFSNAALHWITQAADAARCIARALKPNGRFVAEFGGHGNIARILTATQAALKNVTGRTVSHGWYFPQLGEYAALLEAQGLEVRQAALFDRPTQLEGPDGMRNWLAMFAAGMFAELSDEARQQAFSQIEACLQATNFHAGNWMADYRRLRIVAVKPA